MLAAEGRAYATSPLLTGKSNTTSLPVSFLYTAPNVSSLYSVVLRSFGSRYTCAQRRAPAHGPDTPPGSHTHGWLNFLINKRSLEASHTFSSLEPSNR